MQKMAITLTIEPAGAFRSHIEFRDYTDSVTARIFERQAVYKAQNEHAAFLEYDLLNVVGIKMVRHMLHAHYVRNGYRLMLSITASVYRPNEQRSILEEVIRGVRFVPKQSNPGAP